MSMISMPKSELEMIFNTLGALLSNSSGPSSVKLNKSGKPKKQNSNKGKPTCHGDFVKMICEKMKDEVAAFKAANPEQKGAHLVFAANYKKEHAEEVAAFEASWKEAHPKDAVSETGSVAGSVAASDAEAPADAKPKRIMSDEQKAKMKAGREAAAAAKKAEKNGVAAPSTEAIEAAPASVVEAVTEPKPSAKKAVKTAKKAAAAPVITAPVATPLEVTSAAELLPFSFNGGTYLRMGSKLPNGESLYTSGHLWMSGKKGAKGPHYGELKDDGTIDMEVEEPKE